MNTIRSLASHGQLRMHPNRYVLITPARNEGPYIRRTIDSVLRQTILPHRWVIVSDSSSDDTDAIAAAFARKNPFITFLRLDSTAARSFTGKVRAFRTGVEALGDEPYDFIGNLDADVTFSPDYYGQQLKRMADNRRLGVCSGVCWDATPQGFRLVTTTRNHAVGAVQFFRRECFEAIGGYNPAKFGGIDSMAVFRCRLRGWKTQCFPELPVQHHKPVGSASAGSAVKIALRSGQTEYHIGSHALFAVVKALRRWRSRPIVFSVFVRLYGYYSEALRRVPRDAGDELTAFVQREQMDVLRRALKGDWKRF